MTVLQKKNLLIKIGRWSDLARWLQFSKDYHAWTICTHIHSITSQVPQDCVDSESWACSDNENNDLG